MEMRKRLWRRDLLRVSTRWTILKLLEVYDKLGQLSVLTFLRFENRPEGLARCGEDTSKVFYSEYLDPLEKESHPTTPLTERYQHPGARQNQQEDSPR